MPCCRFFKVNQSTNWDSLYESTRIHELNMRKTQQYKVLTTIVLPQNQFDSICEKIYLPDPAYREFASMSVASLDGIWNCIVLCEKKESRKLIIYTAGQMYPLYAGIEK